MNTNKALHEPGRVTLMVSMIRDVTSVTILGFFLMLLHYFAQPFRRGFTCDDESIRYPYKDSTIEAWVLHLVGALLNIHLIIAYEYISLKRNTKLQPSAQEGTNDQESRGLKWRTYLCNAYCRLLILLFGMIISESLTEISKFSIGRLRPHFFSVCKPELLIKFEWIKAIEYCNETKEPYKYHTDYRCTGELLKKERDSRLSFMSGHSSYAAYCAVHAVIYLQMMMDVSVLGLVKPSLQAILIASAFYTGLSRVSDYKHHWQDVLAGLLQGTLVAIIICRYVFPSFKLSYARFTKQPSRRTPYDREMESGDELNHVY